MWRWWSKRLGCRAWERNGSCIEYSISTWTIRGSYVQALDFRLIGSIDSAHYLLNYEPHFSLYLTNRGAFTEGQKHDMELKVLWHPHQFFGAICDAGFLSHFLPRFVTSLAFRTSTEIAVNRFRWREIRLMVLSPKSGILTSRTLQMGRDLNDKPSHSRIFCFFAWTPERRFCKTTGIFFTFWGKNHSIFLYLVRWSLFSFLFFIEQMVDSDRGSVVDLCRKVNRFGSKSF